MAKKRKVRFVRIRGRVVPIREKKAIKGIAGAVRGSDVE